MIRIIFFCVALLITSCKFEEAPVSNVNSAVEYTPEEIALIQNIGKLHNKAIESLYEDNAKAIPDMLESKHGLIEMANLLHQSVISSEYWTLSVNKDYNYEQIVSVIEDIFLMNYADINEEAVFDNFMLYNLDNSAFIDQSFSNIDDYKSNIPLLIENNPNAPDITLDIMINVLESSSELWGNKSLHPATNGNRFRSKLQSLNSNTKDLDGFICGNGVIIADAEGSAIGFVAGGVFGSIIGGAMASIIMNEMLDGDDLLGDPVCEDD